ncbi:MAG TPA: alkaline phosphatase PhoX [Thermoleophilaceae bacterium]
MLDPGRSDGLRRRELIQRGLAASVALAASPALLRLLDGPALAASPRQGPGPYGPLEPSGLEGVQVPKGFSVREVARAGTPIGVPPYVWPPFPDGSGSFAQPDGGWIFVANTEVPATPGKSNGGVSAIRFDRGGSAQTAYRILDGTRSNCGGGTTPWGTWLSGEEVDDGLVWECDPKGERPAVPRPALGVFSHEYVVVHEAARRLYLTEDQSGGGFYRFTPSTWGDLGSGVLEMATLRPDGLVAWGRVPDPSGASKPTRQQVPGATGMKRPEGLCVEAATGIVYFVESSAGRVFAYDPATEVYVRVYAEEDFKEPILTDTDNITVSPLSGDLFVCEDAGDLDVCIISREGEIARFVHLDGPQHGEPTTDASSETTGPSWDPSGTRFYFSSQRAYVLGVVYEVTGPWRRLAPATGPTPGGATFPAPGTLRDPASSPLLHFRIEAHHRLLRKRLPRHGLRVSLIPNQPADGEVRLTVPVRGSGGKPAQPKRVTIASGRRKGLRPGRTKVRLRLNRRGRRYIARLDHPVDAQLVASATDSAGRLAQVTRKVRIR